MNTILNRRSIRKYLPDALPKEALEQIVAAGKMAPSGMNQQRYHITVVTNAEKMQALGELVKKEMLSNPNLPEPIRQRVESPDFSGTSNAPAIVLVSRTSDAEDSSLDAALVCENMMLAARALEIGSCWLGAFSHLWKLEGVPEMLRSEFGIPEGYELFSGIVYGYPDGGFPDTPRVRRDDNVNWVE